MIKTRPLTLSCGSIQLILVFRYRKVGELGLLAPTVSEESGGAGMDAVLLFIVFYG